MTDLTERVNMARELIRAKAAYSVPLQRCDCSDCNDKRVTRGLLLIVDGMLPWVQSQTTGIYSTVATVQLTAILAQLASLPGFEALQEVQP